MFWTGGRAATQRRHPKPAHNSTKDDYANAPPSPAIFPGTGRRGLRVEEAIVSHSCGKQTERKKGGNVEREVAPRALPTPHLRTPAGIPMGSGFPQPSTARRGQTQSSEPRKWILHSAFFPLCSAAGQSGLKVVPLLRSPSITPT